MGQTGVYQKHLDFISYLKRKVKGEPVSPSEIQGFLTEVAKDIDRCKVDGQPSHTLERLYSEVEWLLEEIGEKRV